MTVTPVWDADVATAVTRLTAAAQDEYYNPYQTFDWPDRIPDGALWMSEDLISVHGTAAAGSSPASSIWPCPSGRASTSTASTCTVSVS